MAVLDRPSIPTYKVRSGSPGSRHRRVSTNPGVTVPREALARPSAVPGISALPSPPPGPGNPVSEFGWLYGELTGTGGGTSAGPGTMTSGTLEWKARIPLTVNPTIPGGYLEFNFTQTQVAGSGLRGIMLDRSAGEDNPHGICLKLGGNPAWDIGMDSDSSVTPFPDLILAYAHGITTPGDVFRMSQRSALLGGVKYNIGGEAIGSPDANGVLAHFYAQGDATSPVGGVEINVKGTPVHLNLVQRTALSDFCSVNMGNNKMSFVWDFAATQSDTFRLVDVNSGHSVPSASNKNRLYVTFPNTIQGAVGLNCSDPQGLLEVRGRLGDGGATVYFNRFFVGCNQPTALALRSINLEQIINSSGVHNYMFLNGTAGSTGTVASPTTTTGGQDALVVWGDVENNRLHLAVAPSGTNQTPLKGISIGREGGAAARLGFFGMAPVIQQSIGSVATDEATAITLVNNIRAALLNLGLAIA